LRVLPPARGIPHHTSLTFFLLHSFYHFGRNVSSFFRGDQSEFDMVGTILAIRGAVESAGIIIVSASDNSLSLPEVSTDEIL
jgi:hypothetical protein